MRFLIEFDFELSFPVASAVKHSGGVAIKSKIDNNSGKPKASRVNDSNH